MAYGVTKVQNAPVPGFFFVGLNDSGFKQTACRNYSQQRVGVPLFDGLGAVFHEFPQDFISSHSRLDYLGHTLPELLIWQSCEKSWVDIDLPWLLEGPEQVFAFRQVHPCLAADAAVHLGKEGRRNLKVRDAAHVNRRQKTCY